MSDLKFTEEKKQPSLQELQQELSKTVFDLGKVSYDLALVQDQYDYLKGAAKSLGRQVQEAKQATAKELEAKVAEGVKQAEAVKPTLTAVDGGKQ